MPLDVSINLASREAAKDFPSIIKLYANKWRKNAKINHVIIENLFINNSKLNIKTYKKKKRKIQVKYLTMPLKKIKLINKRIF